MADLDGFIRESVASLRDETARLASEVLTTIDSSENGVDQRTLNQLTTFIHSFRTLNFAGDQQLEQTLARFRRDLLPPAPSVAACDHAQPPSAPSR